MDVAIDLGVTSFEHAKALWPVVLKDEVRKEYETLLPRSQSERTAFLLKTYGLGVESISRDKLQQLIRKMNQHDVYVCPTLLCRGCS